MAPECSQVQHPIDPVTLNLPLKLAVSWCPAYDWWLWHCVYHWKAKWPINYNWQQWLSHTTRKL